ncbi:MAG TPA: DUF3291 domain-containing protein [Pseudonocardiaceae bacterium]|jgi:hypothetical protein|nr:DUF3291 domain-containing protein [Pseudonocardiaceae bacterium]
MGPRRYELAQVNIGRLLAPLDDPLIADFVSDLVPVNAVADRADGFVWRLQDGPDATSLRIFDDDWLMVNMSVWTTPAALVAYIYGTEHRAVLRRRREWFARLDEAMTALWWVPADHRPTVKEAERALITLRANGPTAESFTLRELFPAPDGTGAEPIDQLQRRRPAECG